MSDCPLVNLPPELIASILAFLSLSDLVSCRRTSKLLNSIVDSSVLLQYLVELQVAGAVDDPASPLSIADRLHLLKTKESAWESLECTRSVSVPVDFNSSSIYDLTGGVFLLGESLLEPFIRTYRETDAVRLHRLTSDHGSVDHDRPSSAWSKITVEASILDVGLAVEEHDLIAVVTHIDRLETRSVAFDVHLIQITTGEHHPQASHPVIRVSEVPMAARQCSVSIEIVGNMLAILINFPFFHGAHPPALGEFHMFNWLTGKQKLSRVGGPTQYLGFVFLSPDVISLVNCSENSLELCYIGDALSDDSPDSQPLETVCRLALPRLAPVAFIRQVLCRSEPNSLGFGNGPAARDPHSSPFRPDPKEAVVIFNLFIRVGELVGRVYTLSLIVHRSALLAWLPPHPPHVPHPAAAVEDAGDDDSPRRGLHAALSLIPWAVWGPPVTRWLNDMSPNNRWITTTCGQRHIAVSFDFPFRISLLNFNQVALRRFVSQHTRTEGPVVVMKERIKSTMGESRIRIEAVFEPSTLFLEVFDEAVVSCLPYLMTTTDGQYEYSNVLLDEDRIIGVNLDESENIRDVVVHPIKCA